MIRNELLCKARYFALCVSLAMVATAFVPHFLSAQNMRPAARAEPRFNFNRATDVYMERIVVRAMTPYSFEAYPKPPISGYYAWKIAFGGDAEATVVLRTDSAIRALSIKDVMKEASLYVCPPDATSILACTQRIQGTARALLDRHPAYDRIEIEITEPSVIARVREKRPEVMLRQQFEPDGRHRVDYVYILYNDPTLRF